jgi:hypothetical protein
MSGTHLYYNGVLMRDCELLEWDQVIEKDESQTDYMFSRFRISVASTLVSLHSTNPEDDPPLSIPDSGDYLSAQHLSTIAIKGVDGESLIDRMQYVEQQLRYPRKDFWFALNATTNKPLSSNVPSDFTPASDPSQVDSYRVLLAAAGIDDFDEVNSTGRVPEGRLSGPRSVDLLIDREDVIDANNGPHPQSVKIQRIDGGRAMRVSFTIEVCRILCTQEEKDNEPSTHPVRGARRVEGVISNRWSITESMDESWETTHTISGTLRVADQRYKPHAMRLVASPMLFPYAKLVSREFAVDKTGLVLQYSFSMKETGYAPPPGVISWDGTFTESTTTANAHSIGELSVSVKAAHKQPPGWDRNAGMLVALHDIARSRIKGLDITTPFNMAGQKVPGAIATTILESISITEVLGKPELRLRARVRYVDEKLTFWKLRLAELGQKMVIPFYDERFWPIPEAFPWSAEADPTVGDQGSYLEGYYQIPCHRWHVMPRGYNQPATVNPVDSANQSPAEFQAYTLTSIDPTVGLNDLPETTGVNHAWSAEQLTGATYLEFDADDTYRTNIGRMHLPLSKERAVGTETQTSVSIPIHAGVAQREMTLVATRLNAEPEIPQPTDTISNSSTGLTERILESTVVAQNSELQSDGVTLLNAIKVVYKYSLSRPIKAIGGTLDSYRRPSSPKDLSTPQTTLLSPADIQTVNKIEVE